MGIAGLLGQLKNVMESKQLHDYRGKTVAVDAMSWLHRGCYSCAMEIAMNQPTNKYISFIKFRIGLLKHFGITPILVFDGKRAALKAVENNKRQSNSESNQLQGKKLYREAQLLEGSLRQEKLKQASEYFMKAVKPTQEVVAHAIEECRHLGFSFVVAPYEADAQLVWLCKSGQASAIITEDSDLLVYCATINVSCPILYKLDKTGSVKVLSLPIIKAAAERTDDVFVRHFRHFLDGTREGLRLFVQFCILSGCDFVSLPGIGYGRAMKYAMECRDIPGEKRLETIFNGLDKELPEDAYDRCCQAEALFYHHIVFDAKTSECRFLVSPVDGFVDILHRICPSEIPPTCVMTKHLRVATFLGSFIFPSVARDIYEGRITAQTLVPVAELAASVRPKANNKRQSNPLTTNVVRSKTSGSTSTAFTPNFVKKPIEGPLTQNWIHKRRSSTSAIKSSTATRCSTMDHPIELFGDSSENEEASGRPLVRKKTVSVSKKRHRRLSMPTLGQAAGQPRPTHKPPSAVKSQSRNPFKKPRGRRQGEENKPPGLTIRDFYAPVNK